MEFVLGTLGKLEARRGLGSNPRLTYTAIVVLVYSSVAVRCVDLPTLIAFWVKGQSVPCCGALASQRETTIILEGAYS